LSIERVGHLFYDRKPQSRYAPIRHATVAAPNPNR
jgi:hypothetical protein